MVEDAAGTRAASWTEMSSSRIVRSLTSLITSSALSSTTRIGPARIWIGIDRTRQLAHNRRTFCSERFIKPIFNTWRYQLGRTVEQLSVEWPVSPVHVAIVGHGF